MVEFRVGRGHDGPARVGEYIIGDATFETPLVIGPTSSKAIPLHYGTLGRDANRQTPMIMAIPFAMKPEDVSKINLNNSYSFLLPSMPAFASLETYSGIHLLRYQLEFIDAIKDTIDPSRLIIRVPENIQIEDFKHSLQDFQSRGIRAASFTFDGLLGLTDLDAIRFRSVLPSSWLTIALGTIAPSTLPLLYYTGFDIIDSGFSIEAAVNSIRLWRNDSEKIESNKPHRFCSCIHCVSFSDDSDSKFIDTLRNHNLDVFNQVLSESTHAMMVGRLRGLVDSMTHFIPNLTSLVRQVDKRIYSFIEQLTPPTGAAVAGHLFGGQIHPRTRDILHFSDRGKNLSTTAPIADLQKSTKRTDSTCHNKILLTISN